MMIFNYESKKQMKEHIGEPLKIHRDFYVR
jgi:hypothetical protein